MSKKPKPSSAEEEEEQGPRKGNDGEPGREPVIGPEKAGKYYYDDAYGYEDYKPELEEDEETK